MGMPRSHNEGPFSFSPPPPLPALSCTPPHLAQLWSSCLDSERSLAGTWVDLGPCSPSSQCQGSKGKGLGINYAHLFPSCWGAGRRGEHMRPWWMLCATCSCQEQWKGRKAGPERSTHTTSPPLLGDLGNWILSRLHFLENRDPSVCQPRLSSGSPMCALKFIIIHS